LAARVEKIEGFSAHADKHELDRLVTESNLDIDRIAIVHGEESQSRAFAAHLKENGYDAVIPAPGEVVSF
jgi:metallo-beta-lactamase family protein